jgi:transcriptional regulator with XRE-family HTH domain
MVSIVRAERFSPDESTEWLEERMLKLAISTYQDLSDLVGIDRGTISRYFRHERRPSIDVIAPLCEVLKVSPETLLIVLGALNRR